MAMDRIQLQASYKYFAKVIHIIGEWIAQIYLTQPDIRLYLNTVRHSPSGGLWAVFKVKLYDIDWILVVN